MLAPRTEGPYGPSTRSLRGGAGPSGGPGSGSEPASLLLVDDDVTLCGVLSTALRRRGLRVQAAHSAAQARGLLETSAPDFAVLDLRLPDLPGLKLLPQMLELHPHLRVLVFTSYASIPTAIQAIKLGAVNYLPKPAHADQVLQALVERDPGAQELPPERPLSINRLAWEHIQRVLAEHDGSVSAAARALNMHRRTLQRKLAKNAPRG